MDKLQSWEAQGPVSKKRKVSQTNGAHQSAKVIPLDDDKERKLESLEDKNEKAKSSIQDFDNNNYQDQDNFYDPSDGNPLDMLNNLKAAEDLENKVNSKGKTSIFMKKSMYVGLQKIWRRETIQYEGQIVEEEKEVEYLEELDKLIQLQDKANIFFFKNMNSLKKAKLFQDKYPFLRFRRGLLYFSQFISILSEKIIRSALFESVSLIVIMANSVTLALQSPLEPQSSTLDTIEFIFLILYTIEMFLKIFAKGFLFNKTAYLRDNWNILDFIIVTTAYIPLFFDSSSVNLSGLRSLRVLRPLKTITRMKNLRILLLALFSALPLLIDVLTILLFFFFIFAISGVQLYAGLLKNRCIEMSTGKPHPDSILCGNYDCPDNYFCAKLFDNPNWGVTNYDNILYAFLMTFQTVTLEGWTQIMESVRITFNDLIIIYYIFLVFVGSFFLLNITLAVIKAKFSESQSDIGMARLLKNKNVRTIIPKKEFLLYINQWSDIQFRKNMFFMISPNKKKTFREEKGFCHKVRALFKDCFAKGKKNTKEGDTQQPTKNPKERVISIDEHLARMQSENKSVETITKEFNQESAAALDTNANSLTYLIKRRSVNQESLVKKQKRESITIPSAAHLQLTKRSSYEKNKPGIPSIYNKKVNKNRQPGVQAVNDWMNASALKKKFDLFLSTDNYFSTGNTLRAGSDFKKLSYFSIASINTSLKRELNQNVSDPEATVKLDDEDDDNFINSIGKRTDHIRKTSEKFGASKVNLFEKIKKKERNDKEENLSFSELRTKKIKFTEPSEKKALDEDIKVVDLTSANCDEMKQVRRNSSILKKSSFQKHKELINAGTLSKISSFSLSSEENSPKIFPSAEKTRIGISDSHEASWEASQDSDFSPFEKKSKEKHIKKFHPLERNQTNHYSHVELNLPLEKVEIEKSKEKLHIQGLGESKTHSNSKIESENCSPSNYGSPNHYDKITPSNNKNSEASFSKNSDGNVDGEIRIPHSHIINQHQIPNMIKKNEPRRLSKVSKRRDSRIKELQIKRNSLLVRKNSLIRKLSLSDVNNTTEQRGGNLYQKKLSMNTEDAMIMREKERCEIELEEKRLKKIFITVDLKFNEIFIDHSLEPLVNSAENVLPSKASKLEEKKKLETDRLHKEMKMKMEYKLKKFNIKQKNNRTSFRFSVRHSKLSIMKEKKSFVREMTHSTLRKFDTELKKSDTNVSALETPFKSMTSIMLQHKESKLQEPMSAGLKKNNSAIAQAKKFGPHKASSFSEQNLSTGNNGSYKEQKVTKNKRSNGRSMFNSKAFKKIDPQEIIKKENYEIITSRILEDLLTKEVMNEIENKENNIFNTKPEYLNIKKLDLETMKIKSKNWSGDDVLTINRMDNEHINKIFTKLNKYKTDIWAPGWRGITQRISNITRDVVEEKLFENFIILAVIFNTGLLATDGLFDDPDVLDKIQNMNLTFTIIFTSEMLLKLMAYGVRGYVRDNMNLFDGAIVIISIVEILFLEGGSKAISAFRTVRIFRTFRVLRVTKLLRSLAFMKVIIGVVSRSIQSFGYIAALLMLFIYIYTLMGIQLFGGTFNFSDSDVRQNFDTFNNAFLVVFQVLSLENWQNVLFLCFRSSTGPLISALYLLSWIFIGNYVFLNLFLAILLDGFTSESAEAEVNDSDEDNEEELKNIQIQVQKNVEIENKPVYVEREVTEEDSSGESKIDNEFSNNIKEHKRIEAEANLFVGIECETALYFLKKDTKLRRFLLKLSQHHIFDKFILVLIIGSSLKLAFDTYQADEDTTDENDKNVLRVSNWVDVCFNMVFAMESLIKSSAYGFIMEKGSYLREPWNVMDFFIVCSSLLDMSLDAINIPIIKIFRLLRILRPLRFITHNINLKIVVVSLMNSVSAIINVLIVVLLVWLMFAILGISFLQNKMGYCNFPNYIDRYQVNKDQCINELKMEWKIYDTNFDNIFSAMVTLFIISSLEGWPDIMALAIDADDDTAGPSKAALEYIAYYFVAFILIGSFFFLNLFTGAIFFHFNKAQKNEKNKSIKLSFFLTEDQMRWIQMQEVIIKAKPEYEKIKKPQDKRRLFFYEIVNSNKFEGFIMVCIILNILTMAITYEGSTQQYDDILENINYAFTAVFIMEAIIKIIAYTFTNYWYNPWNKFDFFVVSASIFDIVMNAAGKGLMAFIRFGPQLARIFRVLRITRLFKLIKSFQGLQKLIQTIILTLPSLINVGALMFLIFFIYSILGNFMFKNVKGGVVTNELNNFSNFHNSIILLFRCTTGEDWYKFMFDHSSSTSCYKGTECGNSLSPLFFISFLVLSTFVMLNLFILIILEQFEEYHLRGANPFESVHEHLELFRKTWSLYSIKYFGLKIHNRKLIEFMRELVPPLGFGKLETKENVAKNLLNMNLEADAEGCVYFNDLLFAAMKRVFGENFYKENAQLRSEVDMERIQLEKYIKIHEKKTKAKLDRVKKKIYRKEAKLRKRVLDHFGKNTKINPFFFILYVRMAYTSWRRYTQEFFRLNNFHNIEDETLPKVHRGLFNEFSLILSSESEPSEATEEIEEGHTSEEEDGRNDDLKQEFNDDIFEKIGERESEEDRSESENQKRAFESNKFKKLQERNLQFSFDDKLKARSSKRGSWAFPMRIRSNEEYDIKPDTIPRGFGHRFGSFNDLNNMNMNKVKLIKLLEVVPSNLENTDDNGDNTERKFIDEKDSELVQDKRESPNGNSKLKLKPFALNLNWNGYRKVEIDESENKTPLKKEELENNVSFL